MRALLCFTLVVVMVLAAGCTRHASRAFLFEEESAKDGKRNVSGVPHARTSGKPYGSNPVFVAEDSKFSIRIDEVNPGWLLQRNPASLLNGDSQSAKTARENYQNKELWILTTIIGMNPGDPLESKSKRYFKSSTVKFGSSGFSSIPIDVSEATVFTHDADMSYRVAIRVFEVDGFAFKREVRKLYDDPGIYGVLKAGWNTLKSTASSVVGAAIVRRAGEAGAESLALERVLLLAGATEEFFGEFYIVRDRNFVDKNGADPLLVSEYVLFDRIKGSAAGAALGLNCEGADGVVLQNDAACLTDYSNYRNALQKIRDPKTMDLDQLPLVRLSVTESLSPTATGTKAIIGTSIAGVERDLNTFDAEISEAMRKAFESRNLARTSMEIAEELRGHLARGNTDVESFARNARRMIDQIDRYGTTLASLKSLTDKIKAVADKVPPDPADATKLDAEKRQLEQEKIAAEARLRAHAHWMLIGKRARGNVDKVCTAADPKTNAPLFSDPVIVNLCGDRNRMTRILRERDDSERLLAHLLRTPD